MNQITSVGIDVSKGFSMVAIRHPGGVIVEPHSARRNPYCNGGSRLVCILENVFNPITRIDTETVTNSSKIQNSLSLELLHRYFVNCLEVNNILPIFDVEGLVLQCFLTYNKVVRKRVLPHERLLFWEQNS